MCNLEALKTVSVFSLLADNVHSLVQDLAALRVALGPVVPRASLATDHVVWAEELADVAVTRSHLVNRTWLQVDQNGSGEIAAALRLKEVNVSFLELRVGLSLEISICLNALLVSDYLPELGSYLVATLAGLNVYNFSHILVTFLF